MQAWTCLISVSNRKSRSTNRKRNFGVLRLLIKEALARIRGLGTGEGSMFLREKSCREALMYLVGNSDQGQGLRGVNSLM